MRVAMFLTILLMSVRAAAQKTVEPEAKALRGVKVYDATQDKPVEGATVWFRKAEPRAEGREERGRRLLALLDDRSDPESALELDRAESAATGSDGRARVPASAVVLAARQGTSWSFGTDWVWRPSDAATRLEPLGLRPCRALALQVVDGSGLPVAGIPVRLDAPIARDDGLENGSRWHWRARSGAEGMASFQKVPVPAPFRETMDLKASVTVIGADPVRRRLDPFANYEAPPKLALPAFGTVEIRVRTKGAADVRRFLVQLDGEHEVERDGTGAPEDEELMRAIRVGHASADGRFPCVAVGVKLVATIHDLSGRLPVTRRSIEGPREAGQAVVVELDPAAPANGKR